MHALVNQEAGRIISVQLHTKHKRKLSIQRHMAFISLLLVYSQTTRRHLEIKMWAQQWAPMWLWLLDGQVTDVQEGDVRIGFRDNKLCQKRRSVEVPFVQQPDLTFY
jgi:hypothetical protein